MKNILILSVVLLLAACGGSDPKPVDILPDGMVASTFSVENVGFKGKAKSKEIAASKQAVATTAVILSEKK